MMSRADFTCRYTHKTKGGVYTVVAKALLAGEIGNVFTSIIVYRNEHGDVFVRSLRCFNDKMNLID